jgi:hypothetical protein
MSEIPAAEALKIHQAQPSYLFYHTPFMRPAMELLNSGITLYQTVSPMTSLLYHKVIEQLGTRKTERLIPK